MYGRAMRIACLYNNDFEFVPGAGADAAAVRASAEAICQALRDAGHESQLVTLQGRDLVEVLARLQSDKPDLVFNLCESLCGVAANEVAVPAVLDLFGFRYTGSDAPALALALHKAKTKDVLHGRGISTPPYRVMASVADIERVAAEPLDYPWFIKLANEDASVGITEANVLADGAGLAARAKALFAEFGSPLLAERYVPGREVNVTLLGSGKDTHFLPLHEIDFGMMPEGRPHIVSYAAKWDEKHVDYAGTKPVPIKNATPALVEAIQSTARAAWDAIGLRDYGRVDLRIDAAGVPWVIDVNPNCDISPDAGVARAAAAHGWPYPQLIGTIAELALKRYKAKGAA
jgi:D-alanine-D-alanine ligase